MLKGIRQKRVTAEGGDAVITDFGLLPIEFMSVTETQLHRVFTLAQRLSLTLYDAIYLSLAQGEGGSLASLDSAFPDRYEIEIDNNRVENAIRPIVIGKKNWLFIGASGAGSKSAALKHNAIFIRIRGIAGETCDGAGGIFGGYAGEHKGHCFDFHLEVHCRDSR